MKNTGEEKNKEQRIEFVCSLHMSRKNQNIQQLHEILYDNFFYILRYGTIKNKLIRIVNKKGILFSGRVR